MWIVLYYPKEEMMGFEEYRHVVYRLAFLSDIVAEILHSVQSS